MAGKCRSLSSSRGFPIPFPAVFTVAISFDQTAPKTLSVHSRMQIQLKCSCENGSCPEWAIIELQGVVEVQPSFIDQLQNLEIGKLCHPSQGVYTFTVGYHELTGSKVPLKKPLLVLKKVKHSDADESSNNSGSSSNVELSVIGIIRHRILFKTRPKALISRPQPFVKEKKTHVPDSVTSSAS